MAIIAMPASLRIKHIEWTLDRPAQVNRSAYTGTRAVVANPWHGKWSAKVELAAEQNPTNILAWKSFFAQLKGQVNTFKLPATESAQVGADVTASATAAQGALTMTLSSAAGLIAGMLASVTLPSGNEQLLMIVNVSGSTITFEPALREAIAIGAAVKVMLPVAHVALASSSFTWMVDPGTLYSFGFDVEEAF